MKETLSWALRYAKLGWAVFPIHGIVKGQCTCGATDCADSGKHPILRTGANGASTDKARIRRWFETHPNANIGVVTGIKSGITVFDIDIADGKPGAATWTKATEECGEAETLVAVTGSGGRHVIFKYNSAIPSTTDWIGKGLDVRNDGGYIVVAPSAHRSGGAYKWENWGCALADIPKELTKQRRKRDKKSKRSSLSIDRARDWLEYIPQDDRTIWRDVGIILGRELDRSEESWKLYQAWADKWGGKKGRNHDGIMREAFYELSQQNGDLTAATLFHLAKENGWVPAGCVLPALSEDARGAAQKFYNEQFFTDDCPTIIYWAQEWFCRYKGLWVERSEDEIDRFISERLANCTQLTKKGDVVPYSTTPATITSFKQLLTHIIQTPSIQSAQPPLHYKSHERKDTWHWEAFKAKRESVHCRGAVVNLITEEQQSNVDVFMPNGAPWRWKDGSKCPEWHRFLRSIFEDKDDEIHLLQQWIGYVMSTDVEQQKGLIITGPTRAGKGVISHIITSLLGINAVASPTLASLGSDFGMQQLLYRRLCLLTDARISKRADVQATVEQLLKIIADDPISVARKFKSAVVTRLGTRVMIVSNDLPNLYDSSPAINKRFMLLKLWKSFYGKEDVTLLSKLQKEIAGIACWARDGYCSLRKNGRFSIPESSRNAVDEWWRDSSPINTFAEECLSVSADARTASADMFAAYKAWCDETGAHPMDRRVLGKALCIAFDPHIKSVKSNGKRYLTGVKILALPGDRYEVNEEGKVINLF